MNNKFRSIKSISVINGVLKLETLIYNNEMHPSNIKLISIINEKYLKFKNIYKCLQIKEIVFNILNNNKF